jgi:hypothetical protein
LPAKKKISRIIKISGTGTLLMMLHQVEAASSSGDTLVIQVDAQSGEVISEKVRTIRGPDGASRVYKTVERLHNGE